MRARKQDSQTFVFIKGGEHMAYQHNILNDLSENERTAFLADCRERISRSEARIQQEGFAYASYGEFERTMQDYVCMLRKSHPHAMEG